MAASAGISYLPRQQPGISRPNAGKNKTELPSVLCRQAACPETFISCPNNICLSPNSTDSGLTEEDM